MRKPALLFALVLFTACMKTESPEQASARMQAERDSATVAIRDGNARWDRYVNGNNPDSVASLFTPDGVTMPPDVPGATGRDSIMVRLRPLVIPGGTLTITSQNITVNGPMATDRGVWTYTAPAAGGNPAVNARGKYLSHWHQVNGQWLIAENIWNTDAPAPPPPPARRS